MISSIDTPDISKHLLWEFDLDTFDYNRSSQVVIERVVERGTIKDWNELVRFFGKTKILDTVERSKQISKRDKFFAKIFLRSSLLNAVQG